jgi:hypothetical protein
MGIGIFNKYFDNHSEDVEAVTFQQIVERIEAIHVVNPRPLKIPERFMLYTRRQQRGETAADYNNGRIEKVVLEQQLSHGLGIPLEWTPSRPICLRTIECRNSKVFTPATRAYDRQRVDICSLVRGSRKNIRHAAEFRLDTVDFCRDQCGDVTQTCVSMYLFGVRPCLCGQGLYIATWLALRSS